MYTVGNIIGKCLLKFSKILIRLKDDRKVIFKGQIFISIYF